MTEPTVVESTMIRRVADHLRRRGVVPEPLVVEAGVDVRLADASTPPTLIPFAQAMHLYDLAARALSDPGLSLSIALEAEPRDYGLTGLLWQHQPTIRAALIGLEHYYNLFFPNARLTLVDRGDTISLRSRIFEQVPGVDVFRIEILASVAMHVRRIAPTDGIPVAASFARAQHDLDLYRRVFQVEPSFDPTDDADELVLPSGPLDRPNPTANPVLLAELLRAAETHADRRRQRGAALGRVLVLVGCTVDLASGVVTRGGEQLPLTTKERALLEYLAQRRNDVVSHADIERDVWGMGKAVISHAPAVAIRRLRQKIEPAGRKPVNLQTVFGEGWRLVVDGG